MKSGFSRHISVREIRDRFFPQLDFGRRGGDTSRDSKMLSGKSLFLVFSLAFVAKCERVGPLPDGLDGLT